MTAKAHKINELADFLKLTPEEFKRMLPDFATWYAYGHTAHIAELKSVVFTWFDDGRPGEIHSISVNDEVIIKGPAFKESAP